MKGDGVEEEGALLYLIFIWMPHSNVKAYRRLVCQPIHNKCHVIAFDTQNDKNAQARKLRAASVKIAKE